MNQILDYNPNKNSGGGSSSGSDKIVRVFAVILAIFAICLLASGAYRLYKKNAENTNLTVSPTQAQISVEQKETTAVIKVSHDKAIEKIIYSWDNDKEMVNKGNGESTMEVEIPLAAGEHTLNIKVTDIDGVESTYEEVITSATGEDKVYPVVTLEVTQDKKLKIVATDETELSYITYRWNDEEEEKVEVTEDDNKKIEFEIDILKGTNDLTVSAVDKNNNTTTEMKSFSGVTKPDVKITIAADKKSADVYSYHENGIKEIKLKVNDQDYNVDIGTENPKEVSFNVELGEGNNVITVTAISVDDTETVATEEIAGEQNPENPIEISIEKPEDVTDKVTVRASSEAGIKEVKLNVNDVDYNVNIGTENPKEVTFDLDLVEGNNKITLTIVSVNGTEKKEVKEFSR